MTYVIVFVVCLFLSLTLTKMVRNTAIAKEMVTAPELDRHVHTEPLPRLGGVAVYLSVTLVLIVSVVASRWRGVEDGFSALQLLGMLGPATIVFLLGVYDDLKGANAYLKFSLQAAAAGLLYLAGYGVEHFALFSKTHALGTALGLPITVFWVLLVT